MTAVKIYSTETCPFCQMEKEYLDARGIKYESVLVDHDRKAAEELTALEGGFGVPFTVFTKENGEKESVLGFDKKEINRILGIS